MKSKFVFGLSLALMALSSFAQTGRFAKVGTVEGLNYNPVSYKTKHYLYYYIPKSFKSDGTAPTMVLLHGGGSSTDTFESANEVALQYLEDFVPLSEKYGMPVVAPTSSIGWNYPTSLFMRDLVKDLNAEMKIDSNRIFLFGHSMGGMGITREAGYMTDLFSGFMPTAAGMAVNYQTDRTLRTYFNTRFTHINGTNDHFADFATRANEVKQKMVNFERLLGLKSGYTLTFHPGEHNYDLSYIENKLTTEILPNKRNLYQTRIFPVFGRLFVQGRTEATSPDVNYKYDSYFWLQAKKLVDAGKTFRMGAEAKCVDNKYEITLTEEAENVLTLRILVSSKMVDLSKPIVITVNGKVLHNQLVKKDEAKSREIVLSKNDPQFLFDTYVDVNLK